MPITLNIRDKVSTIWCLHPECLLETSPFDSYDDLEKHIKEEHTPTCVKCDDQVEDKINKKGQYMEALKIIGSDIASAAIQSALDSISYKLSKLDAPIQADKQGPCIESVKSCELQIDNTISTELVEAPEQLKITEKDRQQIINKRSYYWLKPRAGLDTLNSDKQSQWFVLEKKQTELIERLEKLTNSI